MKISYNWLKEILPVKYSPEETAALLTACGLEVESIEQFESIKGGLKGLVIGEVKTCIKHPDADKLKLTTVDVGQARTFSNRLRRTECCRGTKSRRRASGNENISIRWRTVRNQAGENSRTGIQRNDLRRR